MYPDARPDNQSDCHDTEYLKLSSVKPAKTKRKEFFSTGLIHLGVTPASVLSASIKDRLVRKQLEAAQCHSVSVFQPYLKFLWQLNYEFLVKNTVPSVHFNTTLTKIISTNYSSVISTCYDVCYVGQCDFYFIKRRNKEMVFSHVRVL